MALAPLREGVVNRMDLMETSEPDISARDRIVLERLARGEASAITELYDRYGSALYSLMVCIVGDAPLAEDLVQEVFVRVWRFAGSYRGEAGSVRCWLFAIAHHCAVDAWRRRQREHGWLSMEASTVKSRIRLALEKLRARLGAIQEREL